MNFNVKIKSPAFWRFCSHRDFLNSVKLLHIEWAKNENLKIEYSSEKFWGIGKNNINVLELWTSLTGVSALQRERTEQIIVIKHKEVN